MMDAYGWPPGTVADMPLPQLVALWAFADGEGNREISRDEAAAILARRRNKG